MGWAIRDSSGLQWLSPSPLPPAYLHIQLASCYTLLSPFSASAPAECMSILAQPLIRCFSWSFEKKASDTGRCTFYSFRHRHLCSPTVVPAQADDFKYAFLKMPKIFSAFCCFCQKSTAIFAHRVCVSTKCDLGLSLMSTSGEHGFKNDHLRFADETEIVNFGGVHRRLWTSRHQLKKQVYF